MLRQQVGRLTPLEHLLLTWLAVLREWTELPTLLQVLHPRALRAQVLEVLEALRRRPLLERGQQASFSLQSVVMEYLTDDLGERLAEEIVLGNPQQLRRVALAQAQAKDYVRETQVRLLVHPLLARLRAELGTDSLVEAHLLRLLAQFRSEDAGTQGYAPANVISLLTDLRGHLRDLDLSRLAIRGAYLQGVEMQDARLSGATLHEVVWTSAFDTIRAVAMSPVYWLVGTSVGIKATLRTRVSIFTMGPRMKEVGLIIDQHRLGSFPPLLVKLFSSGEGKVEELFILGTNGHDRRPQSTPKRDEIDFSAHASDTLGDGMII